MEGTDSTRRVIIVDDEPAVRRVLARALRRTGWAVEETGDGREALVMVAAQPPDVVLTDVNMPHMDGIALVEAIKEQAALVPVVVMTGSNELAPAVRALRAGAADYLTKPVELDLLYLALDRAVERARLEVELRELRREREAALRRENARLQGELRATEEQLVESRRMEALGRLASGVAHDFNNVLSVVMFSADLIGCDKSLSKTSRGHVQGILTASRHGAALTGQLLAFVRRQVLEPKIVDLNDIVRSLEDVLRRAVGTGADLLLDLATDLGSVKVDPTKIGQVLMNLVVNARDAMPKGGRITVRTANESPAGASASRDAIEARWSMVAVTDTGTGMDPETAARIFEPFFTTKGPGRGTGLGLATVLGVVQQSGGRILLETRPDAGTTFRVYFPYAHGEEHELPRPALAPSSAARTHTILLADDDPDVRALLKQSLETAGHRVLAAGNATEGEALSRAEPGPIALLLTDVRMPGESGIALSRKLRKDRPNMIVVYISGYDAAIAPMAELPDDVTFVQKPIERETLLAKLHALLGRAS